MTDDTGTLLVPVANVETADRVMDTAIDIAADRSYQILVMHVVAVPPQVPLSEGGLLTEDEDQEALEYAKQRGVDAGIPTEQRTRFARGVATGIVGASEEHDVDAILMGWRGRPPRRNVILGSHLDRVLRKSPCDVLVQRIRTPRSDVGSVLVPVASGPHNQLAVETAGSIARQHDAPVHLLHVLPSDPSTSEREEGERLLEEARSDLGDVSSVDVEIAENDHAAGEITDRTAEHDLTLVGASQKNVLRRKFLGTVSEAVGRHAAGTVVIAQRAL